MPQRISITYICSLCDGEHDEKTKLAQYKVIGPRVELNYDICTACAESDSFANLLARGLKESNRPAAASSSGEMLQCEQCPREFETKLGLGIHMRKAHGIVSETKEARRQRAARNSIGDDEVGDFACEHPGCGRSFDNAAKLSGHTRWHKNPKPPRAAQAK